VTVRLRDGAKEKRRLCGSAAAIAARQTADPRDASTFEAGSQQSESTLAGSFRLRGRTRNDFNRLFAPLCHQPPERYAPDKRASPRHDARSAAAQFDITGERRRRRSSRTRHVPTNRSRYGAVFQMQPRFAVAASDVAGRDNVSTTRCHSDVQSQNRVRVADCLFDVCEALIRDFMPCLSGDAENMVAEEKKKYARVRGKSVPSFPPAPPRHHHSTLHRRLPSATLRR